MSEPKTKATKQSVTAFLKTIEPKERRDDSAAMVILFQTATGEEAVMWGTSIIGFGMYHVESGKNMKGNDWPLVAFSPRKQNLTLYVLTGDIQKSGLLEKLGKHTRSGGCLHIKKLSDVDRMVLSALIKKSFHHNKKVHG